VPGVLIAEALAQLSGIAGATEPKSQGKLAHIDVRFEKPVPPPVEIELEARVVGVHGPLQMCEVSAHVGATSIARGSITLHWGR
jgi:3-hydroxymyristoyl/3-hydroxydecanoyl-(acyl carrier protein) dehydratase